MSNNSLIKPQNQKAKKNTFQFFQEKKLKSISPIKKNNKNNRLINAQRNKRE